MRTWMVHRYRCRLLALIPLVMASGCMAEYYLQLGLGQLDVLAARRTVPQVYHGPDTSERVQKKLRLVSDARRYARERLGLAVTGSYAQVYDAGHGPVSWNLSATPATSLTPFTWTFPVVGAVPYKGFFRLGDALREARALEAAGYDVRVRDVSAYSTLGWFDDPLFSHLLAYRDIDLVNVIFHELLHATVYRPGDTDFNESLATFVGNAGTRSYLRERHQEVADALIARYDAELRDQERFAALMNRLIQQLEALYLMPIPDSTKQVAKEVVLARARATYREARVSRELQTDQWDGFLLMPLNNARLRAFQRYHFDLSVYEAVYQQLGEDMPAALAVFGEAAEAEHPRRWLQEWLDERPSAVSDQQSAAEGSGEWSPGAH